MIGGWPIQLVIDDRQFVFGHVGQLAAQVFHRDPVLVAIVSSVNVALPIARQMHDRFAHRL